MTRFLFVLALAAVAAMAAGCLTGAPKPEDSVQGPFPDVDDQGRQMSPVEPKSHHWEFDVAPVVHDAHVQIFVRGNNADTRTPGTACLNWSRDSGSSHTSGSVGNSANCSGRGNVNLSTSQPGTGHLMLLDWSTADLKPGHYTIDASLEPQANDLQWDIVIDQ